MEAAGTTKIRGKYNAVVPERDLIAPYEDYFYDVRLWEFVPDDPVEEWFSLNEQARKECIRRRAGERCAITGNKSREVHELYTRGAHGDAALVPWNMEVFAPEIHDHLQNYRMRIVRFDPLDDRDMDTSSASGCMILFDLDGHVMKQEDVFIYHRESLRDAKKDIIQLEQEIAAVRKLEWSAADRLRRLKENGGFGEGGYDDIYQLGASFGLSSAKVKEMIRASTFADKSDIRDTVECIDMAVVSALSKIPDEDLVEVLQWFATLPPAEAWERYHEKYPPKTSKRKFLVMRKEPYKEVSADSVESVECGDGDMIIRGSVIVGVDK